MKPYRQAHRDPWWWDYGVIIALAVSLAAWLLIAYLVIWALG